MPDLLPHVLLMVTFSSPDTASATKNPKPSGTHCNRLSPGTAQLNHTELQATDQTPRPALRNRVSSAAPARAVGAQQPGPPSFLRIPVQLVKMSVFLSWSIPSTLQHHVCVWEEPPVTTKGQGRGVTPSSSCASTLICSPKRPAATGCDPGQWQGRDLEKQRCSTRSTQHRQAGNLSTESSSSCSCCGKLTSLPACLG